MRKVITSFILPLSFAPFAFATEHQETMVVTATQIAQPIADVDASVEVISRKQIETFSGRSLSEVLRHSAGLQVTDTGSSSNISIRGFEDGHTLILVDGQRRTEKYAGSNVNNISLENVERIEIVRGPMSALYGADALGGVINIITRTPEKSATRIKVSFGGATNDEGRETALIHLGQDFKLGASSHTVGVELKDRKPYTGENGLLNEEDRKFFNYRGHYQLSDDQDLRFGYEYLKQDDTNAEPDTGRFEKEKRHTFSSQYNKQLGEENLAVDFSYGESDTTVNRGTGDEFTDYSQTQLDLRYSGALGDAHLYNFGAGYRHDDAVISINSTDAKRDVFHLYAQDQWQLSEQFRLITGLRYDRYSDFGSSVNPRISLSWRQDDWKVRAGYGRAFSAPSYIEMFSTFSRGRPGRLSVIQGNADLQPEEADTYELSVHKELDNGSFEITAYHSDVDQLIASQVEQVIGTTTFFRQRNIDEATLKGLETNLNYHLSDAHHLNLAIEYQDVRDASTNERLTGRARLQGRFTLDSEWNSQWSTSLRAQYQDDFLETHSRAVPAYNSNLLTFDMSAKYRVRPNVELFSGVNNIFDTEAPENMNFRGIPQDPGSRYVYAGVSLTY